MSETAAIATTVRALGPQGMITLRGDLASDSLRDVCTQITGAVMPEAGQAQVDGDTGLAWMSPDELLVLVPQAQVGEAIERIDTDLAGQHHLAVDVSDARSLFAVEGPAAREVIAKLCPVDMAPAAFAPGNFRRTRMAQIPAAFWMEPDQSLRLICFRSVDRYARDLLTTAAMAGPVGYRGGTGGG
ncbi:MAG: sarcosine oxidase subunit gamma family protein [Salibaculum sp.]|jgi:sarcosine oxidase subunit gamma|uniref:sarcosine oxidase subunit gamma n=1 Tax=Salibaculum sp. TaxID=2855480 RepID=UPI0028700FA4|nr:sarcosine oxidase subunit gamma family protein [Salibaculum sp.]MDR9427552.1 sarcosine oxidase subunit gamma family protein [Salibaculum sp.]MDR9482811.1 sarcosine oxidase subunit gamma family protein [Salibaculum sp.]